MAQFSKVTSLLLRIILTLNLFPNLALLGSPKSGNLNKTLTENYSWYFYRSDHLISNKSQFRDTRRFDGFNIFHFHKNTAGFFRTFSKCPEKFDSQKEMHPVHIRISRCKFFYFLFLFCFFEDPY
jgi:hypothetical protein